MTSKRNIEIAAGKVFPKFLSITKIMHLRTSKYNKGTTEYEESCKEIGKHLPDELKVITFDIYDMVVRSIRQRQEDPAELIKGRFDKHLENLGIDSLEVAEAFADPTLNRLDTLTQDITQILSKYIGTNPLPVLKDQMSSYFVNFSKDLSGDKSSDNLSGISPEDRKELKEKELKKFYEKQIAEKYAKHMMNLKLLQENLPDNMPEPERQEGVLTSLMKTYLRKKGLVDFVSFLPERSISNATKDFLFCSIDSDYLDFLKTLDLIGGVDVEMDGKTYNIFPLDHVALVRKDLTTLKKLKDHLVDIAMDKGLDTIVNDDDNTLNEGLKFAYDGKKEDFIHHQRFKQRVEYAVRQSFTQGKISLNKFTSYRLKYQSIISATDQNIKEIAEKIFGDY